MLPQMGTWLIKNFSSLRADKLKRHYMILLIQAKQSYIDV